MIFFAMASANQNDIVEMEARQAGSSDVYVTNGGVEFEADLAVAYRFCLWTRTATRVLLALFQDESVTSADELYESAIQIPWEDWITPERTFAVTETVSDCKWLKNSHFAALRVQGRDRRPDQGALRWSSSERGQRQAGHHVPCPCRWGPGRLVRRFLG
jgi:23S rRNA (guanine2445-N2)-methyltransferase / 23S rRNA (guanine2069-N7)-methyltransferase